MGRSFLFFEGGVIADSYARSGHGHRLMDKVWMRSFVGENLSYSLQGGIHKAWASTQSFLPTQEDTSTIQRSQTSQQCAARGQTSQQRKAC